MGKAKEWEFTVRVLLCRMSAEDGAMPSPLTNTTDTAEDNKPYAGNDMNPAHNLHGEDVSGCPGFDFYTNFSFFLFEIIL